MNDQSSVVPLRGNSQLLLPLRGDMTLPNPEEMMYIAYNMYVADDSTNAGSFRHKVAVAVAESFVTTLTSGVPLEGYMRSASANLVSYVGAIRRLRRSLDDSVRQAQTEHDELMFGRISTQITAGSIRVAVKLGVLAILAALGVALAQILSPFIPQGFGDLTGHTAPSVAGGAGLTLFGIIVSSIWSTYTQAHINNRFSRRVAAAWMIFSEARLSEYNQHLFDLCEIWKLYTGKDYKVVSSLSTVLEDDRDLLSKFWQEQKLASRGQFQVIVDGIKSIIKTIRNKNGNGKAEATKAPA